MQSVPASELPPNKHQERSIRTRTLLLDAAIESLSEVGYAQASTADISDRAGVTRGAFLHHFHTRSELFSQAIDHLTARQRDAVRQCAATVSETTPPADALVALVASMVAGELGRASVELYVAIRHDDDVRKHMLSVQHDLTHDVLAIASELIGPRTTPDRLQGAFWITVNLVRGSIVDDMIGRNPIRRKELLARWTDLAAVALAES
jgi:AcrR family transcriptional regulator